MAEIESAVRQVVEIRVLGGVAVRTLDAWCLAIRGEHGTEALSLPKDRLEAAGCASTEDRVAAVDQSDLSRLPEDARSLRRWLQDARSKL